MCYDQMYICINVLCLLFKCIIFKYYITKIVFLLIYCCFIPLCVCRMYMNIVITFSRNIIVSIF